MRVRWGRLLFGFLCLQVILPAGAAATGTDVLAGDKQTLLDAKVPIDGPGLVAFFRSRVVPETDRTKLAAWVRRLGDDSFEVREQASRDLIAAGRAAGPIVQAAVSDPDAE